MTQIKIPDYNASTTQTQFHTVSVDDALFGGKAGGGKTAALVAEGVTIALEHPGIPINFFRRTIPELKSTILPEIYKQCATYIKAGHMTWHGVDRVFKLANESTLHLNYLDTDADVYRYQGTEMPVIIVDELTQFPMSWIEYIKTRNRTSNPGWPIIFRAATNPGGVGHGWVKTRYIDISPPNTVYTDPDNGEKRIFIPSSVDDHPIETFRIQYKKKLEAITDLNLKRALLYGDWDVFSGQVFTEWRRDKHVVEPFSIPSHWVRWFSYDHGYNTYASGSWFAKDPESGRKFKYRELYVSQMGVSEIARQIKQLESGERVPMRLADPAIWKGAGNQNTGETVAEMFAKEKITFQPANNDRMAGKAAFHEALSIAPDGLPWLQYFSSCVNSIRTIPSLPYDQHRVEDVDTKTEDHCVTGDTLVNTVNGQVKISDLVDKSGMLYSRDGLVRPFTNVRQTGVELVYETTLANGDSFKASAEHLVLTKNGWKQVYLLQSTDMIQSVTYGSNYKRRKEPGVWRKTLLSLRKLLPEKWQAITQNGMGVSQWQNTEGNARSPQRPQQTQQQSKQLDAKNSAQSLKSPYEYAGEQSKTTCAHAGSNDSESEGVAQFPCGETLAHRTRETGHGKSPDGDYYLRNMQQRISGENAKQVNVLSRQLSGKGSAFTSVRQIRKLSKQPVYNLEVEGLLSFSINGGVVVHNCYDSDRYGLVAERPAKSPRAYTPLTSCNVNKLTGYRYVQMLLPQIDEIYIH